MDRRLFAEAKTAQFAFRLTIVLSIAHGLVILLQAFLLSRVITHIFLGGQTLEDVLPYLLTLIGVVILRGIINSINDYAATHIAIAVKDDLRQRLINHIIQLGPTFTRGERSGELVLAATEGIEALNAYFKDYIPGLFTALIIPLVVLFVVFPIDLLTFVVLLITAPLIPLFMALIGMMAGAVARENYLAMGRMSAHFMDVLQGLTTLKLFNRSRLQIQTIGRITSDFRETTMSVLRVAFISSFTLELLSTLSIALVAVEIGLRLLAGTIEFEQALFLLVIAPEYYLPLRALGMKFHAGTEGSAAAARIFDVLDQPLPDGSRTSDTVPDDLQITFKNVTMRYDEETQPAIQDVSFTIEQGQRLALVGASGGGKSTIANLILRFITPTDGSISVDDTPLHDIDARLWREKIAWVPQAPYIFNSTIADNIRLGKQDATQAAVETAARAAHAHDFIMALPNGYDTVVGERGSRLSGGQAQRIAIARAFIKDAPIIIFDEATSNLDPETEAQVERALTDLLTNRTALIIAHRLNTIASADRILVMAGGHLIEQGSHQELMQQDSTYRQLVESFGSMSYV